MHMKNACRVKKKTENHIEEFIYNDTETECRETDGEGERKTGEIKERDKIWDSEKLSKTKRLFTRTE